MKSYKRSNGLITMRDGGGRFRKTTLKDVGVYDGNDNGIVYVCNVCGREFVPIVHSGKCCDVDNKHIKEIILTTEQQEVTDKIKAISAKPFISRQDLEVIQSLQYQLNNLKKAK